MSEGNKVCDATCKMCVYFQGWFDNNCCCNYILITGHKRPCAPGKGCTVRVKRKRPRKMKKDRENEQK